ncbi:MAG: ABC transporter ATP-binding protein [Lachnospiraceae bacterium]|nr:ABC transporter ATP-binding protein [Lachnospiraceae bacterium]
MDEILKLEHYSVSYDGEHNAVEDVSFSVGQGEIISIVGESGSGKSTLLHGLQGLLPAGAGSRGNVLLFGKKLSEMTGEQLRRMRGEEISMIFQDTGRYLNPISKIGRQYRNFLSLHRSLSKQEAKQIQKDMLQKVHLNDAERILNSYPFELSGGMRQRVGIAMAMSLAPKLLLADEPTSALDVTVQAQVVRQMMELREKEGTSIVIVTHNMGVAAYMSDRIGVMQQGRLVEWGKTEDVIDTPRDAYTRSLLDAIVELKDERFIEQRTHV